MLVPILGGEVHRRVPPKHSLRVDVALPLSDEVPHDLEVAQRRGAVQRSDAAPPLEAGVDAVALNQLADAEEVAHAGGEVQVAHAALPVKVHVALQSEVGQIRGRTKVIRARKLVTVRSATLQLGLLALAVGFALTDVVRDLHIVATLEHVVEGGGGMKMAISPIYKRIATSRVRRGEEERTTVERRGERRKRGTREGADVSGVKRKLKIISSESGLRSS